MLKPTNKFPLNDSLKSGLQCPCDGPHLVLINTGINMAHALKSIIIRKYTYFDVLQQVFCPRMSQEFRT